VAASGPRLRHGECGGGYAAGSLAAGAAFGLLLGAPIRARSSVRRAADDPQAAIALCPPFQIGPPRLVAASSPPADGRFVAASVLGLTRAAICATRSEYGLGRAHATSRLGGGTGVDLTPVIHVARARR
jgi:hypothetical protein